MGRGVAGAQETNKTSRNADAYLSRDMGVILPNRGDDSGFFYCISSETTVELIVIYSLQVLHLNSLFAASLKKLTTIPRPHPTSSTQASDPAKNLIVFLTILFRAICHQWRSMPSA